MEGVTVTRCFAVYAYRTTLATLGYKWYAKERSFWYLANAFLQVFDYYL